MLVPLNADPYLDLTIVNRNSTIFQNTMGTLDANGRAKASFNVPATAGVNSFTLHHAYVVFERAGGAVMASQAVPVYLK